MSINMSLKTSFEQELKKCEYKLIDDIKELTSKHKTYINIECNNGHQYDTTYHNFVIRGRRCKHCAPNKPIDTSTMGDILNNTNYTFVLYDMEKKGKNKRHYITYKCNTCNSQYRKNKDNIKRSLGKNRSLCSKSSCNSS